MSEVVVHIENVTKKFRIPKDKENTFKGNAVNAVQGKRNVGYDVHNALNGVTFEIRRGDFVGVLGRNGAGKSTLLKIIAEIYQPSSGRVSVKGKLVPFIELGVGFNPNLTGKDNVYLNGAMLGFSRPEITAMYDSIVEFAELRGFMDQKLKNYSSGMQVRLAFSLAIRADADILLLDEVLAVGDAAFQQKCYEYFDSLKENGKTIILVSHNVGVVKKYCNRVVLVDKGVVAFDGTAEIGVEKYLDLFESRHKKKNSTKKELSDTQKPDKKITINNLNVDNSVDHIHLSAELMPVEDLHDIKFGFQILDSNSRVVAGVNTKNVSNPITIDAVSNKVINLKFTIPNILGNGRYSVAARVGSISSGQTHDKVVCVGDFENRREDAWAPIVLPSEVKIEK